MTQPATAEELATAYHRVAQLCAQKMAAHPEDSPEYQQWQEAAEDFLNLAFQFEEDSGYQNWLDNENEERTP